MSFFCILLKREVETGRQTMAERIKLSQWMLGRTVRATKRHSPVNCMVPPDTVTNIQSNVFGKHEPGTYVSIGSNAKSQHGDAGVLLQIASQVMDVLVLDDTQWNKSCSSKQAEASSESIFSGSPDSNRMPICPVCNHSLSRRRKWIVTHGNYGCIAYHSP